MNRVVSMLVIILAVAGAYEIIASYRFKDESSLENWSTSWKWQNDNVKKGSCSWTSLYNGTVKLSVSGAPCAIEFWHELPRTLQFGDMMVVKFYCPEPLYPISDFDMMIGPTEPYGHKQEVTVSTTGAGWFVVHMPVYSPVYKQGTPFGLRFSVWPGSATIYVKEISLVRGMVEFN
ncbi:MAG: hypothetical protein ABIK49_06470 [candidate division WOR-3 bacterium]